MIPSLRRTLYAIALAAPLAGCPPIGSCPELQDTFYPVGNMPDQELADFVASCRATQYCEPLCITVYERAHSFPPSELLECELFVDANTQEDTVRMLVDPGCIGGRRPARYRPSRRGGSVVAAYLCEQAELEAASVRAFHDLHADLVALGAPDRLRRAALAAARDEVRHAEVCARLAQRFGGVPRPPSVPPAIRRSRGQLALDNLVEGCIRETYGAVIAGYQARAARDPHVKAAMRTIARDEASHAALSWQIHRWLWSRLSSDEQRIALVAAARGRAELDASAPAGDLQRTLGLPDGSAARAMLASLDAQVWHDLT